MTLFFGVLYAKSVRINMNNGEFHLYTPTYNEHVPKWLADEGIDKLLKHKYTQIKETDSKNAITVEYTFTVEGTTKAKHVAMEYFPLSSIRSIEVVYHKPGDQE